MKFFQARLILWSLTALAISFASCDESPPQLKLIIDADTANEVDDLYAIVRAAIEPTIDLIGVTSAQFHISPLASDTSVLESQHINETFFELMDIYDVPLPMGSNMPLRNSQIPAVSEASSFIVQKAHAMPPGDTLHIAILGACTNVASAILQDPTIVPKIAVHYLGFWHDPQTNTYDKKEFNSGNDTLAVNVLLDVEGLDFNVMTATTSQHLVFEKTNVDQHLKGKGTLGDYLVNRWETYDRWWTADDPQKTQWIMWDLALIEALIHPDIADMQTYRTPPENTDRNIDIYTAIQVKAMTDDFWDHLARFVVKE